MNDYYITFQFSIYLCFQIWALNVSGNAINHLVGTDHLKNLITFLWKYSGSMDQVDSFRISEVDLRYLFLNIVSSLTFEINFDLWLDICLIFYMYITSSECVVLKWLIKEMDVFYKLQDKNFQEE